MTQDAIRPLSARLSWDEIHRLEVLMRTRANAISSRPVETGVCPTCGDPLGPDGVRVAGVRMHPCCLPGAAKV
jgi:hypothetical protein